jgi:hypothetical protein
MFILPDEVQKALVNLLSLLPARIGKNHLNGNFSLHFVSN